MALASLNGNVGILSEAEIIANELGVNSWQLSQGSYNGVVFHVVQPLLNRLNDDLNPAAGILDATNQLIGAQNQEAGDNTTLPYGTTTVSTAITDIGSRKLAIHELPNNEDVFEDMGWRGEIYVMQGIIFGAAYSQALQNIMNVFINDANAFPGEQNVLVHPILGTIQSTTYLIGYKRIYNPNLWRSTMYEFVFRSAAPASLITNFNTSIISNLNTTISSILAISQSVLNTWGSIYAIQNAFATSGNSYSVQQTLQANQQSIQTTVNASLTTAQLMNKNLKPLGYQNVALDQTVTTPTNDIPSYFYFISNMTPSDVNSIISNNNAIIQTCITGLKSLNDNVIYDTITNLLAIQAGLVQLATTLLNSFYGNIKQYVTPYDIDLFSVCVINSLDYVTQGATVYLLNQALIPSANYIPKGTTLNLPISSNKAKRQLVS